MAYATPAQLLERFDYRNIQHLVADGGTLPTEAALLLDPIVLASLDDASGMVDAAMRAGDRYRAADLAALTGNAAKHLARITCDMAYLYLVDRQGYGGGQNPQIERLRERIKQYMDDLRKGVDIFDIAGVAEAGVVSTSGPTTQQINDLNLITRRNYGLFPAPQMPFGR